MYFLNEEEKRFLSGKLLPRAREHEVHPELRGWSWREPPLSPPYEVPLGVSEIAAKYCATRRDVYLSRVLEVRAAPNRAMREGAVLHSAVADLIQRAKEIIYANGPASYLAALGALAAPNDALVAASGLSGDDQAALSRRVALLHSFEYYRVFARIQDVIARQPRAGADSLAALALPVTVEQQLDGTLLGLSAHLSVDALSTFAPIVYDLKFDRRRDFHRLATAAYALVVESLHEYPIDVGCVVYVRFDNDRVLVERDLHLIDDELRQWLIDERDERTRMVSEEVDPGMPDACAEDCPYQRQCRHA